MSNQSSKLVVKAFKHLGEIRVTLNEERLVNGIKMCRKKASFVSDDRQDVLDTISLWRFMLGPIEDQSKLNLKDDPAKDVPPCP